MKILVTGATGFVGSHLVEELSASGHEIYSLVRNQKKAKKFKTPGIHILGGLSTNSHTWIKELPKDLDLVIHTAGLLHSYHPEKFWKINTESTITLFNDLKKIYHNLIFVFISSLAAAGPGVKNENQTEEPVSEYGKSKLAAEKYLKENLPKRWNLQIIRPPMVIGPRDPAILDIFKMINAGHVLISGRKGMEKKYSFINVFDLIDAITLCIGHPSSETFFIAHPKAVTFKEIVNEIKELLKKKRVIKIYIPTPLIILIARLMSLTNKIVKHEMRLTPDKSKELIPHQWICSGKKAEEKLGLSYKKNFQISIKEAYEDYSTRRLL